MLVRPIGRDGDPRPAPGHHVLLVVGVDDRDGHPGVVLHVALLDPALGRVEEEIVAVPVDPQRGDLRRAVLAEGGQRGQDRPGDELACLSGESVGHGGGPFGWLGWGGVGVTWVTWVTWVTSGS